MQRETMIWTLVMLAGGLFLLVRGATVGNGRVYVEEVTVQPEDSGVTLTNFNEVPPTQQNEPGVSVSRSRTIGIWVAALCTLGIMTFVLGDNPFYKLAESIFVGVSAAYLMVQGFYNEIVNNLFGKLFPRLMKDTLLPGLTDLDRNWAYVVPLILSVMMLWRLMPKGSWIARWPLAFFIGATAGIRLISYLEADFVQQINNTILPLAVYADGRFDIWGSIRNALIVIGVLLGLVYFFFSVPHKGVVGGMARGGVWLLMITFGASFGYTVMGRIALLADRLEFLFDDWLWLIDPTSQRFGL